MDDVLINLLPIVFISVLLVAAIIIATRSETSEDEEDIESEEIPKPKSEHEKQIDEIRKKVIH